MKCKHYKGTGTCYRIEGSEICLCDKCSYALIKAVFGQVLLEQKVTLAERLRGLE
jgi:hypothetical protein